MKVDDKIIEDLTTEVVRKVKLAMADAFQLVGDTGQCAEIAISASSYSFAAAARFLQQEMIRSSGRDPGWEVCVKAVVGFVSNMAIKHAPPPMRASEQSRH